MTSKSLDLTDPEYERLLSELNAPDRVRSGLHLTEAERIDYAGGALSEVALEEIDAHLRSCPACCAQLQRLMDAAAQWLGSDSDARMERLRAKLMSAWMDLRPAPSVDGAAALASSVAQVADERWHRPGRLGRQLVAVAALALFGIGTALLLQTMRSRPRATATGAGSSRATTTDQSTHQARPLDRLTPESIVVVSTTLLPGQLRGAGSFDRSLAVSPIASRLDVTLLLERDAYAAGYAATIERVDGTIVARVENLASTSFSGTERAIVLRISAAPFTTDDYIIRLRGLTPDGRTEAAGDYSLRIVRTTE